MAKTKLSGNGGYSYSWSGPFFLQAPTHLYYTAMTNAKIWRTFQDSSSTTNDLATAPELDDHNAPAILARPNKARHAFYTRHAKSYTVNHAKATSGISFVDQGNISHPDTEGFVSYVRAVDYNDNIAIFSRCGGKTWRFRVSTDWGENWAGSKRLLHMDNTTGQKYMILSPSSTAGVYHLAAYGHPVSSDWRGMVYGTVNVNTGDVSNTSGVIANLDGTNLPLDEDSFDDIVPTTGTEVARLFDVGEAHGKPVILYAKWDDANSVAAAYYYAYRDSGTWYHVATGVACGAMFQSGPRYYAGMSINKNGANKLAIAREASGTSYVDVYPINSDMTLGSATTVDSNASYKLVRPYFVEDSDDLVWQELRDYTSFSSPYTIWYWKDSV